MVQDKIYDVVICGSGMAGLALARQLKMKNRDMAVLLLDKTTRPLPEAAFKVGESSVEVGIYYYSHVLQLGNYLEKNHLPKLGLRYFYNGPRDDLSKRAEMGVADWPPSRTYQIDRGKLENDLRLLILQDEVELKEGVAVQDILLQEDCQPHQVLYQEGDGGEVKAVKTRWVVDASGRRRLLQRKLNLSKKVSSACSASWFRLVGELRIDDLVPKSNLDWHQRAKQSRWFSTDHLMGDGYWVWVIPLPTGNTSIGIVTTEDCHPFETYNTYEKSLAWLRQHEPLLGEFIEKSEVLDFRTMRHYSYSSHQVYSEKRWACVGEAGVFVDPYYSVGINMIAFGNGITTKLIELDRNNALEKEFVDHANRFYLSLSQALTYNIQTAYPFYGNGPLMSLKTIWDFCIGWGIADPQFYYETYLDVKLSNLVSDLINRVVITQARIIALFTTWSQKPVESMGFEFDYIDYLDDLPTVRHIYHLNLPDQRKSRADILKHFKHTMDRIEELAQIIFFMAVEDTMPDKLALFEGQRWINTCAMSLNPDHWEEDGLFKPQTRPRDYKAFDDEIRRLYRFKNAVPAGEALAV